MVWNGWGILYVTTVGASDAFNVHKKFTDVSTIYHAGQSCCVHWFALSKIPTHFISILIESIFILIGIGIIFSHTFKDTPSISERNAVGNILNFPLFFGTTLFALVAINIVTSLENNMKTPKKFSWVLNTGMAFVTLLYIAFGFMAYLKYGNDIADTVTLNLPPGET